MQGIQKINLHRISTGIQTTHKFGYYREVEIAVTGWLRIQGINIDINRKQKVSFHDKVMVLLS
jgi:hypothetical protein